MASGQGYETAFAQVVAEPLGVDPARGELHLGNTDVAPYGMGSRGARGGTAGGGALHYAATGRRGQGPDDCRRAARPQQPDQLRLRGGRSSVRSAAPGRRRAHARRCRANRLSRSVALPPGMEPGLEAHRTYDPPPMTFSNATHFCEVRVDSATGTVLSSAISSSRIAGRSTTR